MIFALNLLLLLLLAAVTAGCLRRAVAACRADARRRLLTETYRTAVDAVDGAGVSLLCGRCDLRRLELLLAVEYPACEVVATMDANDDYEAFMAIVERYAMVRVSHSLSHELPTVGIRALYRSTERRFRRLILIDKLSGTDADDRNAAACYASYEYLWPLADECLPAEDAVERVAVAVAECEGADIDVIRTDTGAPAAVYRREAVVLCGGFGSAALERIPRRRIRMIHDVLVWCPVRSSSLLAAGLGIEPAAEKCNSTASRRAAAWSVRGVVTAVALAAAVVAARMGWLPFVALVLTVAVAWSTARYVMSLSGVTLRRLPHDLRNRQSRCEEEL